MLKAVPDIKQEESSVKEDQFFYRIEVKDRGFQDFDLPYEDVLSIFETLEATNPDVTAVLLKMTQTVVNSINL